jgi:hypothetical protein
MRKCEYFKDQKPDFQTPNFTDSKFPPNRQSLCFIDRNNETTKDTTDEEIEGLSQCNWKRPATMFKTNNFFLYEQLEVSDIQQGQLGNCYFLSALSALAEFPERYRNIFIKHEKSENGCYAVRLLLQGTPKIVTIDDHFPAVTNCWFAASSGMKEIWVNVLEKAWAKVNKSYASTIAGLPSESLSCITEAPCFSFIHRKFTNEKIWSILLECDKKDYIICTNTGNNDDAEEMGLVRSHAYSVISCHDYKGLKLVKVRNPWGGFEWKGDYSDSSPLWDKNPELKKFLGYVKSDDGLFFMTFSDFLKYFPYTFVCKFRNNFVYTHVKVHQENNSTLTSAKFVITEDTKVTLGLHQKQQRFYSKVQGYRPQMSRIILVKHTEEGDYEFINSDSSDNEKLYIEADLTKGEYHILGHVHWPYETPCRYVFSSYSSHAIEFEKLDKGCLSRDYFVKTLQSYMTKNCKSNNIAQNISVQVSNNDNDIGFYMVTFKNHSSEEAYRLRFSAEYNEKVLYMSNQVIESREQIDGNENRRTKDMYLLNLEPNTSQMVIWKLLANPWHAKLQLGNIDYAPIENNLFETTQSDQFKSLIDQNIGNLKTEAINDELNYTELELEDGLLIILQNNSAFGNSYQVKVNFSNLENLAPVSPKKLFTVHPNSYDYIRLKKDSSTLGANHNFSFTYSIKKK